MNTMQTNSTPFTGAGAPASVSLARGPWLARLLARSSRVTTTVPQDASLLTLRLGLAAVVFPHGAQKLFGWFGGYGLEGTMGFLTGALGLPAPIAVMTILAESAGAAAVALGFATRFSATAIAVVLTGAMLIGHLEHGFFMNWGGDKGGEGIQFFVLAIAAAAAIAIAGPGRASADAAIGKRVAQRIAH